MSQFHYIPFRAEIHERKFFRDFGQRRNYPVLQVGEPLEHHSVAYVIVQYGELVGPCLQGIVYIFIYDHVFRKVGQTVMLIHVGSESFVDIVIQQFQPGLQTHSCDLGNPFRVALVPVAHQRQGEQCCGKYEQDGRDLPVQIYPVELYLIHGGMVRL